jgi:hypothetical protein
MLLPTVAGVATAAASNGGASNMEERCCQGMVELLQAGGSAVSRPGGTCVDAQCYQGGCDVLPGHIIAAANCN